MPPSDYEKRIVAMFDSFCKTVVRNCSRNLKRTKRNADKHTQSGRVQRPGLETALTDMTGDAPYIGNSNSYCLLYTSDAADD